MRPISRNFVVLGTIAEKLLCDGADQCILCTGMQSQSRTAPVHNSKYRTKVITVGDVYTTLQCWSAET